MAVAASAVPGTAAAGTTARAGQPAKEVARAAAAVAAAAEESAQVGPSAAAAPVLAAEPPIGPISRAAVGRGLPRPAKAGVTRAAAAGDGEEIQTRLTSKGEPGDETHTAPAPALAGNAALAAGHEVKDLAGLDKDIARELSAQTRGKEGPPPAPRTVIAYSPVTGAA